MARPRKDDDHRRTETVAFRVTPAERMQLENAAIAAGLSASEYARGQALKGRVVVQQSRTLDHAAFDELRRVGVNLNQLARIANQAGRVPRELARACAALERILVRELGPLSGAMSDPSSETSAAEQDHAPEPGGPRPSDRAAPAARESAGQPPKRSEGPSGP